MLEKIRRDNGLLYFCDAKLMRERWRTRLLLRAYNHTMLYNLPKQFILHKLLGMKVGKGSIIEPPLNLDYANNITIGKKFYGNVNCTILDCAPVTIGNNVFFGPNVSLFTAGHPIHHVIRNSGYEYARPITIGNNVWVGGCVTVMPGVTIGDNAVIGAGSVVTRDIPSGVVAAGNPCRVIRQITDSDKKYAFRNELIDKESQKLIDRILRKQKKQKKGGQEGDR